MLERAAASGGDDGNVDRVRDRAGEIEVVAVLRSVAVHARQEDLAGAELFRASGPRDRVEPARRPSAMGEDLEVRAPSTRIDGDHDALAAEARRAFGDELRTFHRGRVHRGFVRARTQHVPHVRNGADAAPDGERNAELVRDTLDHIAPQIPVFVGGGDIEKHELVGAFLVVEGRGGHGIARIDDVDEAHAFDDASAIDVETRDHTLASIPYCRAAASASFNVNASS